MIVFFLAVLRIWHSNVIQLGLGCELIVCFEHKKNITLCFDAMISGTLVKMAYFANLWRVEINRQLIEAVFY